MRVMDRNTIWATGLIALLAASPVMAVNGSRVQARDGGTPAVAPSAGASTTEAVMAPAVASLNEGFDDVTLLEGLGWAQQNLSVPAGINPVWFQGNPPTGGGPFTSHQGADNSYIAVNYNSTAGGVGTISNWLMTPELHFGKDATLTFWTRKYDVGQDYPDRLEVRLSTNGASTNAGSSATSTGDFNTLLLSINPTLIVGGYPRQWAQYTVTNADGLPRNGSGRVAFRYFVTNAGPTGTNSDYIGVDTFSYSAGTPQYQVAANVTGLVGDGVGLSLNGGPEQFITADGSYVFPEFIDDGSAFTVAVTSQPGHPKQTCEPTPASGTIASGNASVVVSCSTDPFVLNVLGGDGQEVPIHESFPQALEVELLDAAGDPVAGVPVTFDAPTAGASAWLHDLVAGPATTLVTTTSAAGIATVHAIANGEGGCYGVTASHPNASSVGWQLGNIWYASVFSDGFETPPALRHGISVCEPEALRPPLR